MRWIYLTLLVCCSQVLLAQEKVDSLRSFYIQEFPNHFFVWPVLKYRSLSFTMRDRNDNGREIEFKPNNSSTLGLGFYLFEIVFEVTFAIPLGENSKEIYGETDARDLQINLLTKSWGVDLYHQKYSGFYKDDSDMAIIRGTPYPQRPDIDTRNFGISGFYAFNHQKFSLRSSYNFADKQLKSKGSFLMYGTINSFKANADSALLSGPIRSKFGNGSDTRDIRSTTLSIAPGYSYNVVLDKFFINGTATIGPAHAWVYFKTESGEAHYDVSFNTTYSLRLAAGFNSGPFFGGIGTTLQVRSVKFEDIRFENSSATTRFLVGFRFREKGTLKKHIWDFIPFLKGS
jgi:hypothetical protein